jgi:NADH-quinone oxidoreductase subunit A
MYSEASSVVSYGAVAAMIVIAVAITSILLLINKILGRVSKEVGRKKGETFECGVESVGQAHQQFSVRYYLVAIVFLLFDVEVVFMYPWALTFKTYIGNSPFVLLEIAFFALILLGGYIYLRRRKAFDWE